jgi:hypothetical protein
MLKHSLHLLLLAGVALGVVACGSDGPSGSGSVARVRFVHAIADTGALDVRVNGTPLARLTAITYSDATQYEEIGAGLLTFTAAASPSAQDPTRLLARLTGIDVQAGSVLTVVASGEARDTISDRAATLTAYRDDVSPPAAGQARLRIINASPDAGAVDVYATLAGIGVGGTPTFAGVDLKSQSTRTLAAGTYTLTITALSEPSQVLGTSTVTLPVGGAQTVLIRGYRGTLPPGLPTLRRLAVTTMVNLTP